MNLSNSLVAIYWWHFVKFVPIADRGLNKIFYF